jgi:hypothetical protein
MNGIKDKIVVITASSESIDSFVATLSPSPVGLHDLCRGVPARSIRERATE